MPINLMVAHKLAGAIIGKGGSNIRDISQTSGAKVEVQRRDQYEDRTAERMVTLEGTPEQVTEALRIILSKVREEGAADGAANGDAAGGEGGEHPGLPVKVLVPNDMVGHIIGRQGAHIKQVTEETGAEIKLTSSDAPAFYYTPPR